MFDFDLDYGISRTRVTVRLNALDDGGRILREVSAKTDDPLADPAAGTDTRLAEVEAKCDGRVTVVVTDDRVGDLYGSRLVGSLKGAGFSVEEYRIRPGEASKSLAVAEDIYRFLAAKNVGRDGCILALGGGVVSDLAGFVAATWMRGVDFGVFPTTLEADVDASIGGKTAVNTSAAKNLVGVFHQPRFVAIDPGCLTTLEARDVRAGLAESVKHALISSEELLRFHEANVDAILALDASVARELILRNLRVKGDIIEADTLEQRDKRILLNFGHTIGHAIESGVGYTLRHGECVALGMVAACRLSVTMGLLDHSVVERMTALLVRLGLPTQLEERIDTDTLLATIRNDKKRRDGRLRFVLLEAVGRPVVRDDVGESPVRSAFESLVGLNAS